MFTNTDGVERQLSRTGQLAITKGPRETLESEPWLTAAFVIHKVTKGRMRGGGDAFQNVFPIAHYAGHVRTLEFVKSLSKGG